MAKVPKVAKPVNRSDPANPPSPKNIPLPADGIGSLKYWQDEIDQSQRRIKKEIRNWRIDLDRTYRQDRQDRGVTRRTEMFVNIPKDFQNTELKKGQLFFQTPYVQCVPERDEVDAAMPLFQQVLNFQLGNKAANAKRAVEEALVNVLAVSGIGPVEIGYEASTDTIALPSVDPLTQWPTVNKLPRTIWERYYFESFSPADLMLPVGFFSTDYDKAPWIGVKLRKDVDQIEQLWGIDKDSIGSSRDGIDESLYAPEDKEFLRDTGRVYKLWYKASLYDDTVKHPDLIRLLILVGTKRGGTASVAVHQNSPYQRFDPQSGRFLQGMRGFPIHPLAIRVVTDTAYPPSDVRVTRSLVDEQAMGRTQMITQRRRNNPLRIADKTRIDPNALKQIESNEVQQIILNDGPVDETVIKDLTTSPLPGENFSFNTIANQEIQEAWGQDTPTLNREIHSATEIQDVQTTRSIRIDADREHVLDWFIKGVEKFANLILVYGNNTDQMIEIVGPQNLPRLKSWNLDQIQGRYAFSLRPDSSVRLDAAQQRAFALQFFNLTQNAQGINHEKNLEELIRDFNKDPADLVLPPQQPPPPRPEPPKVSVTIKGEDLDPSSPQYPNICTLLQATGVNEQALLPQARPVNTPPPPHKAAPTVAPVSKHQADLTGRLPNHPPVQGTM
jgi:hypothetical protein